MAKIVVSIEYGKHCISRKFDEDNEMDAIATYTSMVEGLDKEVENPTLGKPTAVRMTKEILIFSHSKKQSEIH